LYTWVDDSQVPQQIDIGNQTTSTLTGLLDGHTYTFAVTDYDTAGDESAYSNTVTVTLPTSPGLVSPPPQSVLADATVPLTWSSGGQPVDEWWMYVGTSVGANDLFDSGSLGSALSTTVSGLPTDGEVLFVRLWYRMGDLW